MPTLEKCNEDKPDSVPIYTYRSKSITERRTLIWEIEEIEKIMSEGMHKAFGLEFQMGHLQSFDISDGNTLTFSKWRLQLDTVNEEPALSLLLLESTSKVIYYKLAAQVIQHSGNAGPNINAYPQDDYFYEATPWELREKAKKFTLHRQLDFGSSYSQWLPKCVGNNGTLRLKVDINICEAVHTYPNSKITNG